MTRGTNIDPRTTSVALIACTFELYAAHRRSLLQEAAAEDASRAAVHVESSDTVRSRKAQCQAPPDNPETGDTITVEEEAALARKNSTKTYTSGTDTTHHDDDYHPHDSKQRNYWVELVRVCRLAVAAAAAFCS